MILPCLVAPLCTLSSTSAPNVCKGFSLLSWQVVMFYCRVLIFTSCIDCDLSRGAFTSSTSPASWARWHSVARSEAMLLLIISGEIEFGAGSGSALISASSSSSRTICTSVRLSQESTLRHVSLRTRLGSFPARRLS